MLLTAFCISLSLSQPGLPPNEQATTRCQTLSDASATSLTTNTPPPELSYSVAGLVCSADDRAGTKYAPPSLLNCSSSSATYTRFVFDMPSRSDTSLVTTLQQSVSYVGYEYGSRGVLYGDYCLLDQTDCATTLCSNIQTISIGIASSPVRVAFNLSPATAVTPFSYLPLEAFGFANSTNCQEFQEQIAALGLPINATTSPAYGSIIDVGDLIGCSYSADTIQMLFGDQFNTTTAGCGLYSDPDRGLNGPQQCQVACLVGVNNTMSEHRRWLVSPIFKIYRLAARPLWNSVIGIVVSTPFANHTIRIDNANPATVQLSTDRKIRVSVAQNYLTQSAVEQRIEALTGGIAGYVFVSNYTTPTMAEAINQGVFNPYLNISALVNASRIAAGGDPWRLLLANQIFFPRSGFTPTQRGAGTVPTYRSTGQVSWFYIPDRLAQSRQNNYAQTQEALLARVINVADASLALGCNGGTVADCQDGIPGWGLNATGTGLDAPSLCQISSGINQYAQAYLAALATMGDVPAAKTAAGPPPLGLFPGYDISAPNVWINNGQVLIDPGTSRNVTAVFSLAVDIVDDQFVFVDAPTGVTLGGDGQTCLIDPPAGNGTFMVSAWNPNPYGTTPIQLTMSAACNITNTTGGQVTVTYSGGSTSLLVPPQTMIFSNAFVLQFAPFNGTTSSITCQVYGTYLQPHSIGPTVTPLIACYGPVGPNGVIIDTAGDTGLGTWAIVAIAVVGSFVGVSILAFIIAIVAVSLRK